MKKRIGLELLSIFLLSCERENSQQRTTATASIPLMGTWQLISGTVIEKGDTTVTDYTKNTSFIKVINNTHFAFLQHDLSRGKDSGSVFAAGGGRYSLVDSVYTEQLEYCSAREWEGNRFTFTVSIQNDTLTQSGIEKVENAGVNRINIEQYVRTKN